MRIGVYVGSFNPVHLGHMAVVNYLIDYNYVDKLIVIPTCEYWDKQDLLALEDRVLMLKLNCVDKMVVNEELGEFKYTYQVMEELKRAYPDDELYLIIGADNIINFQFWKKYEIILENKILILPRDNVDIQKYIKKFDNPEQFQVVDGFHEVDISSTEIRDSVKRRDYRKVKKLVGSKVLNYIIQNNLYK